MNSILQLFKIIFSYCKGLITKDDIQIEPLIHAPQETLITESIPREISKEVSIEIKEEKQDEILYDETNIVEYPIFLKPTKVGQFEVIPEIKRDNIKGIMEDTLFAELWQIFPENIFRSASVRFNTEISYIPDIIYHDLEKKVFIDIEIDEPYTHENNEVLPIHFVDMDIHRNSTFLENGWWVLRFTEEQIVRNLHECIGLIKTCVIGIPEYEFSFRQNQWTYDEAVKLEKLDYRNSYLKIVNKKYLPTNHAYNKILFCGKINISYCYPKGHRRLRIYADSTSVVTGSYSYNDWIDFYCEENILLKKIILFIYPNEKSNWLNFIEKNPQSEIVSKTIRRLIKYLHNSLIIIELNALRHGISLYDNTKFTLVIPEKVNIKLVLDERFDFLD